MVLKFSKSSLKKWQWCDCVVSRFLKRTHSNHASHNSQDFSQTSKGQMKLSTINMEWLEELIFLNLLKVLWIFQEISW